MQALPRSRPTAARAAFVVLSAAALAGPASGASADTDANRPAPVVFGASGWGSQVKGLGPIEHSNRTALASIGCTQRTGASADNELDPFDIPGVADLGVLRTEAFADRDGRTYSATGRTTVSDVELLGGTLTADGIETRARAWRDSTGFHADIKVTFDSLVLDGTEIEVTGERQEIGIEGVGTLVVAAQRTDARANQAEAAGSALVLDLLDGTVVKIGNANASLDGREVDALFSGGAYAAKANGGTELRTGRQVVQHLPCRGTHGKDRSTTAASADLGMLGTVENVTSTVYAAQGGSPEATVTTTIESTTLEVLGAEIRIEDLVTQAHVVRNSDGTVSTDLGESQVGGIAVELPGLPPVEIDIPSEPNSEVELPAGLGSIKFFSTDERGHVRGLRVVGLQVLLAGGDTEVTLGSTTAVLRR